MSEALLGGFSKVLGRSTLCVRVLRERGGFVCERVLIESGHKSQVDRTQVLPFSALSALQDFLSHDPFYARAEREVEALLRKVSREVPDGRDNLRL